RCMRRWRCRPPRSAARCAAARAVPPRSPGPSLPPSRGPMIPSSDRSVNRRQVPVDAEGVAAQDRTQGVVVEVELGDGAGVGGDAGGPGPVAAEDALPGQAVEVEAGEVGGGAGGGEAGEVDPDVGAGQGEEAGGVVPPAAAAVGQDDGEVGDVLDELVDGGRVAEAVDGAGEGARAGVEHDRHALLGAALVDQVEHALGGWEAAVDRVELDRGRAQGELAVALGGGG